MSSASYQSLQQLLQFHKSFLNIVHGQILSHSQIQQRKEALLKFQIMHMGDKNQAFNEMMNTLKKDLIDEKQQYDPILRNYFTKILDLDYLPFLHINRYQLTKLSIFGFDIYVDPLEAILQILNRLQRIFYIMEQNFKECQIYQIQQKKNAWQVLLTGWKNYYIYLNFQKLSLNIYMLKQYIQTAGTSLFKKDKQIVFTGIYNLYRKMVPRLVQLQTVGIIRELADLNNSIYGLHGSFDYFCLYTYLQPKTKLFEVYQQISQLQYKCKNSNILTPLLFGVLNNYKHFKTFVKDVQTPEYIHLLRVLLSGLVINFKLRILEYEELLSLADLIIVKLNLLEGMKNSIITGDIGEQWKQAKQFFISAFKTGYNAGQIQTWNLCQLQQVQPKIRKSLISGILLLGNAKQNQLFKSLDKDQLTSLLQNQISQLSDDKQTLNSLRNNWKKLSLNNCSTSCHNTQGTTSKILYDQQKYLNTIRIVNLMDILQIYTQRIIYSICYCLTQMKTQDLLIKSRIALTTQIINLMITSLNRKQSMSQLKDILPQFHKVYPPKNSFQDIVPVYLHCFTAKEAINQILDVILLTQKQDQSLHIKQFLVSLIQKYCQKSQNKFWTVKSFQKQYKIPRQMLSLQSQLNSVFVILIKLISSNNNKNEISTLCLVNLLNFCPWHCINVLNLPATMNQKIESFASWLINTAQFKCYNLFIQILNILQTYSLSENSDVNKYLHECFYFSVLDNILSSLTTITTQMNWQQDNKLIQKIMNLITLFMKIYNKFYPSAVPATHQNDIQKIWLNLLQLICYIIKSSQSSQNPLKTIIPCCQIYWQLIKTIKKQEISQWFQRSLLNLLLCNYNQNLQTYQTFKGIVLISNSKNYMTSKVTQNQENQQFAHSSSFLHFNFGEIKGFLDQRFTQVEGKQGCIGQSLKETLKQLYSVVEQSKGQRKVPRLSLNFTNDKQILPTLKQQTLILIYHAYQQSSVLTQQKQYSTHTIQFCLDLLKLNLENNQNLWKIIMASQKGLFINHMNFSRKNMSQVFKVLSIIEAGTQKGNLNGQKAQSRSQEVNHKIKGILCLQLFEKDANQLQLMSSCFNFETDKIQHFIDKRQTLWFLVVCNNSNWRQFNQAFSNHLKSKNLLSTLLQYRQFILITKKSNEQYEKRIQQFSQLIRVYGFYIQKKLSFIEMLRGNDFQNENQIRKSTLLINIKVVLIKCELEKILERLITVGQQIHTCSLTQDKIAHLLSSIGSLNKLSNLMLEGTQKLPSFSYHNRYVTQNSLQREFYLGRWLEKTSSLFIHSTQGTLNLEIYSPTTNSFRKCLKLEEFCQQSGQKQIVRKIINIKNLEPKQQLMYSQQFKKLSQKLKQNLFQQNQSNLISIDKGKLQHVNGNDRIFQQLYTFGYLLYDQVRIQSQNQIKLSKILNAMIKREALPLQIIKQIDSQAYHYLKLIIMNDAQLGSNSGLSKNSQNRQSQNTQNQNKSTYIKQQSEVSDIFFVYREKELVPGGNNVKLTQDNKLQFIDLVAGYLIGQDYLKLNRFLALGYLNAQLASKL